MLHTIHNPSLRITSTQVLDPRKPRKGRHIPEGRERVIEIFDQHRNQEMKLATMMAATTIILLQGCSLNNLHPANMDQLVSSARNAEDHAALARHYDDVAKQADASSEEHAKMAKSYENSGSYHGKQHEEGIWHCKVISNKYAEIAIENRNLAKMHRSLSK